MNAYSVTIDLVVYGDSAEDAEHALLEILAREAQARDGERVSGRIEIPTDAIRDGMDGTTCCNCGDGDCTGGCDDDAERPIRV